MWGIELLPSALQPLFLAILVLFQIVFWQILGTNLCVIKGWGLFSSQELGFRVEEVHDSPVDVMGELWCQKGSSGILGSHQNPS